MNCGVDVKLIKMKEIASPFVVGVLSKTIVIPDMDYTNKDLELEHIFKHELIHVKRHDNLYKLVLLISQSIHWFNPIVFFYFRIVERDLEYLCDRQVVQDEGKDYRKQYCNSILQMMENGQINKYKRTRIRCMSDFGQDKKILKERMRNILDKNKAKVKKTTIMIFLFIILIVTSLIIFNKENNSFMDKLGLLSSNSSTDRLEKYGIFEKFNGYSNLDIFPKTITESMNATRYIYRYKDEFLDPSAQIYLECEFDEESYDNELERLQNIYEEYKGINQKIVYDEKTFQYPAYVTINGNNHCYEYALLLGNNKIAYVFLQFIDIDNIEIPTEYLPSDYENINENGYSMYIFYREDGSGFGTF